MQPIKEILTSVGKDIITTANLDSFNTLDSETIWLEFEGPYPQGKEKLLAIEDVGIKVKVDEKAYDFWSPEVLNTIPLNQARCYELPVSTLHTLAFNNFNLLFILAINDFNSESHLAPHREEFEFFITLINNHPNEIFRTDYKHYWRALCNRVINVFKKEHTFSSEFSANSKMAILMEMYKLVAFVDNLEYTNESA
jgi:hypothetical protein